MTDARRDPIIRISITVPASLADDIERYVGVSSAANRSRFFVEAARASIAELKRQELRQTAALLDDDDDEVDLDDRYAQLRLRQ